MYGIHISRTEAETSHTCKERQAHESWRGEIGEGGRGKGKNTQIICKELGTR